MDNNHWLVVWNMNFIFHILAISSSQLTFIFFRGVQTTNQNYIDTIDVYIDDLL